MYWLLLPPSANAQRHLKDAEVPPRVFWESSIRAVWARIEAYLRPSHPRSR